ncbi:MAG: hypothetical protein ACI8PZ_006009 [Myxococcota bacterium]|jgi:hypothetical protein
MLVLISAAALACAGLVHSEGLSAESASQEAIFDVHDDGTEVTYRVTWEGDAAEFGWLIPIPGTFVGLVDADAARFDTLRELTAPWVTWDEAYEDGTTGCGCGGAAKGGDGLREADNVAGGVTVVAEGFTGTYDFAVLQADDPAAIATWLDDNGWSDGGTTPVLNTYADDGVLTLAALRLQVSPSGDTADLPPITLSYTGGDVRFPSRMAQVAMAPAVRTTVWVVDDGPSSTTGWVTERLDSILGDTTDDPVALLETELASLAATAPTFALTYVGEIDGRTVSRFDTLAAPGVHTVDAVFVPADSPDDLHLEIELVAGRSAALGLLPLALLALLRRRD